MKQGITLIGMPGAGKSSLGIKLSQKLNKEFIDLDSLITQEVKMTPDQYMRQTSEQAILDLSQKLTLKLTLNNKIFSPGGSIIYLEQAMEKIKSETKVVYLKVTKEILKKRLENIDTRAIIGLKEYGFDRLFQIRAKLYEKYADITIDVDNEPEDQTLLKLLNL